MRRFDWARLAYLLFVLTALTILVRMGDSGVEALSLYTETRDDERREPPDFKRWTEESLSSLEDAQGVVAGPEAPKIAEPRVPAIQATEDETGGQKARQEPDVTEVAGGREVADAKRTPPVFYRQPGPEAGPVARAGSGPVCGDLGRFPESSKIVFPLEQKYFYSYEDTWGAARPQGGHEGTDLMTPAGVPEYAVTDGTVVPVAGSNDDGWNTLGGYAVMVRADYSIGPVKKGDLFYYAHLERESPLPIGTRVRAGQVIGYAGDTGQGPEVTSGLFPPHLHLGWYDGTGGRSDVDSGAMNPYPLLEWIKSNGGAVAGGSDARYCEALGPPPSNWPDQKDPGVRPDLDTGSDDPRPSPVVRKEGREETAEAGRQREKPERERPARPGRPDKPPKKKPKDDRRRPPDADRPNIQKPGEPPRPNNGPSKPEGPGSGHGSSGTSEPKPPQSSEPDPPRDNDSGGPTNAPGGTGTRPPDTGQGPGAAAGGGEDGPTAEDGTGEDGQSPTEDQYDSSATEASPKAPSNRPANEEREPEIKPDLANEPER